MRLDPLSAVGLVAVVIATLVLVVQLRRTGGLRRRLLVLVVLAALLPAAGVTWTTLSSADDLLALLDAPGVRDTVDGGVGLARELLERERERTIAWADSLSRSSASSVRKTPECLRWRRVGPDGTTQGGGSGALVAAAEAGLDPARVEAFERPRRARDAERTVLWMARDLDPGRLVVERTLDPDLVSDLDRVERGSQGVQQLGLYYRDLLRTRLSVVAALTLLAVAGLTVWLGRIAGDRLVHPLSDLVAGTRRVAGGELEHVVKERGTGEIRELVRAFNGMTRRLAASEERRRRSERIAAWQGVARRLAHEIKNPLTPIRLAVHRLRRGVQGEAAEEAWRAIDEETRHLQALAEEFSALGRLPEPRPQEVDGVALLEEVAALYVPESVDLRWEVVDPGAWWADPGQLRQVASNLLKNAIEAMGPEGRMRIAVVREGEKGLRWEVEDSGPGLPDPPSRVFEPGYTTRPTGGGLGLAIVARIVEDHGGTIRARPGAEGGARFEVFWPTASAAEAGGSSGPYGQGPEHVEEADDA